MLEPDRLGGALAQSATCSSTTLLVTQRAAGTPRSPVVGASQHHAVGEMLIIDRGWIHALRFAAYRREPPAAQRREQQVERLLHVEAQCVAQRGCVVDPCCRRKARDSNADRQRRGAESAGVGVGVANVEVGVCSSATYRAMWHSAAALTGGYHRAFASASAVVVSVILAYIILRPNEDVAEPAEVLAAESEGPP